jgi:hypothetical protein
MNKLLLIALLAIAAIVLVDARPLRFDVFLAICPKSNKTPYCPSKTPKQLCFCDRDFEHINKHGNHYIAVTDDGREDKIKAAGNALAYYHNRMNDGWDKKQSAKTFGAAMYKEACDKFDGCEHVPKWWILNEISASKWAAGNTKYMKYVVDLTVYLKSKGLLVVVAAPFDRPVRSATYWQKIAKAGYIGVENYVSGRELKKAKFSKSWLKGQYQKSIVAFKKMGIAKSRLFLFESYGSSLASKSYGRGGVSPKDWVKTIKMRADAISACKYKGFISYGWWGNQMKESWKTREQYYNAFNQGAQRLP